MKSNITLKLKLKMKHLRLYEKSRTVNSVRNIINEYHVFLKEITPVVIERYKELANDHYFEVSYGEPFDINVADELLLGDIGYWEDGVQFELLLYNEDGIITNQYYYEVTNEELGMMLVKIRSNNYNL